MWLDLVFACVQCHLLQAYLCAFSFAWHKLAYDWCGLAASWAEKPRNDPPKFLHVEGKVGSGRGQLLQKKIKFPQRSCSTWSLHHTDTGHFVRRVCAWRPTNFKLQTLSQTSKLQTLKLLIFKLPISKQLNFKSFILQIVGLRPCVFCLTMVCRVLWHRGGCACHVP